MISRNVPALLWTIPESFLLVQASPVVGLIILQPCLWEVIVTKILIIFAKGHPQLELSRLQGSDMPRRQHERAPDKCCVAPPSESDYYQIHKSASWWADWLLTEWRRTSMNPTRKRSLLWGAFSTFPTSTLEISVRPCRKNIFYIICLKGAKELLSELHRVVAGLRWDWGESFLVSGGLSPLLARVVEPGQAVGIGKHLGLVLNWINPWFVWKDNICGLSNELYTTWTHFIRPLSLFPNGSPFGDPGPHGDLFGDLGPLFMLWVPFSLF